MSESRTSVQDFKQLCDYVRETLSDIESLEPHGFQLTQRLLHRNGEPCGMHFCLHGPRALRLTAIWETDRNTVLFYGSRGERVLRTILDDAPQIDASVTCVAA